MGNARVTVSIPRELVARADRIAAERKMNRSELVEEALRAHLEGLAEEELEARLGLSRKLEVMTEQVDERAGEIAELVSKLSGQEKALTILAAQASERVWALLEAQFSHAMKISFEEAQEEARRRLNEHRRPASSRSAGEGRDGA